MTALSQIAEAAPEGSVAPLLRVAALVDLERGPNAGGHVQCWEKLAAALVRLGPLVDLSVHFSGREPATETLGPHVRFVSHRPAFSTARLPFLSHIPDDTDLAPYHRRLAASLAEVDVIHTTDAYFAFARTALGLSRRRGIPLVNSIHTDTPGYSRIFCAQTMERVFGPRLGGVINRRLGVPDRIAAGMYRRLARHQAGCAFVLVSRDDEEARARQVLPASRVLKLRRGIDRHVFSPTRRDRAWLHDSFGIPADRFVVLAVGRVDRGKNILTLADAVRVLVDRGLPIVLVCAGRGADQAAVRSRLGDAAVLPGQLHRDVVARLYAAADLFAMPSETEVFANAVLEAMASELPVLVAERSGMGRVLRDGRTGLIVRGPGPAPWAEAIAGLAADRDRTRAMAKAARRASELLIPSWEQVLTQDLLPVWHAAARQGSCSANVS